MQRKSAMKSALQDYLRQILVQKRWSIIALISPGLGSALTSYVPPLIIAKMIRDFNGHIPGSLAELTPYFLAFVGFWLLGEGVWRIGFLALDRTDARGMHKLYTYALDHLIEKDQTFFNNNFAGSLTKKVLGYARNFEGFMDTLAFNIIGNILPLIFGVVVLWTYSPLLVLALLGIITVTLFMTLPFIKRRQALVRRREFLSNQMAGHVSDVIINVSAVQAFAGEEFEKRQHEKYVSEFTNAAQKSWDYHVTRIDMLVAPMSIVANVVGLLLATLLSRDAGTIAAMFVVFSYFGQATRILFEFNRTYRNIENSLSEAAEFTQLLAVAPLIVDKQGATKLTVQKGRIEFKDVDFSYSDSRENLFSGLSLTIEPGQKVALVGHSGGGKTTITKLLLRFADITGGELLIDGQNVSDVKLASLRSAIAYVPQDPAMFHRSISDNIKYGHRDATQAELVDAAHKAHAVEFVSKLPEGFDTLVGERGVKLSGGQRQRIAIARAILKDAPILVLDEATSALDSESEKLIQAALQELMKDRTSIVIAHRLSTIQKMDRIIVLEDGRIVEDGSHAELIRKNGTYARLWAHQSGGFIEE